jgi:cytochrome c oxidase cbb3-type subunit 3
MNDIVAKTSAENRARPRFRPILGVAVAAIVAIEAACAKPPPDVAAGSTPPPIPTSVGPVPGPQSPSGAMPNPFANDRAATGDGRQLFVHFNCSGCHGGRAGGGMGPSLRDVDWIYGSSDAQLFSTIAEGRAHGMPSWGPRLTTDQIWKLVTYIKSLRTANEPQPPSE